MHAMGNVVMCVYVCCASLNNNNLHTGEGSLVLVISASGRCTFLTTTDVFVFFRIMDGHGPGGSSSKMECSGQEGWS